MSILSEAAYLYVHSKELLSINRKLKRMGGKAEKHVKRHQKAKDNSEQAVHRKRHGDVVRDIQDLLKKHNAILSKLKRHQVAFAHGLGKEHKIKL